MCTRDHQVVWPAAQATELFSASYLRSAKKSESDLPQAGPFLLLPLLPLLLLLLLLLLVGTRSEEKERRESTPACPQCPSFVMQLR